MGRRRQNWIWLHSYNRSLERKGLNQERNPADRFTQAPSYLKVSWFLDVFRSRMAGKLRVWYFQSFHLISDPGFCTCRLNSLWVHKLFWTTGSMWTKWQVVISINEILSECLENNSCWTMILLFEISIFPCVYVCLHVCMLLYSGKQEEIPLELQAVGTTQPVFWDPKSESLKEKEALWTAEPPLQPDSTTLLLLLIIITITTTTLIIIISISEARFENSKYSN